MIIDTTEKNAFAEIMAKAFFACYSILSSFLKGGKTGLRHSDAEGAFFASSAYKGTPEAENATKKPHKIKKSAENRRISTL